MSKAAKWPRLPVYSFVFFVLLLSPIPAHAHLNSTGMGPIYDGLMHFLLSPEDFVSCACTGAARWSSCGAAFGRRTLFVLPGAWLVGGLTGMYFSTWTGNGRSPVVDLGFCYSVDFSRSTHGLSLRMTTALATPSRHLSRIRERCRNGRTRHCHYRAFGSLLCGLCGGCSRFRICRPTTGSVGANRCSCGGKLGQHGEWFADARMGSASKITILRGFFILFKFAASGFHTRAAYPARSASPYGPSEGVQLWIALSPIPPRH